MTHTYKKLGQTILTGSGTQDTIYTVPASTETIIKHMVAVNYSGSDVTLKMWQDGVADANYILPASTILAGGHAQWDGTMTMEAASTILAEASAATAVTLTIYGMENS